MALSSFVGLIPLLLRQSLTPQMLGRRLEPNPVGNDDVRVAQYDRVMETKLAVAYAAAIEVIYRSLSSVSCVSALDLACGPGHFSILVSRLLGLQSLTGIDLSESMIETAKRNAASALVENVAFRVADVGQLGILGASPVDLITFTDAAHHFDEISLVRRIVGEMEAVTKASGLVFIMDLVRLRTASITDRYVELLGKDYEDLGLPDFLDEFRDSMYAAWTPEEFRHIVPDESQRCWMHLIPRGLPSLQMIVGLPIGRRRLFVRAGYPWENASNPVPARMRWEWRMLRRSLFWGHKVRIDRVSSRSSASLTE